MSYRSDLRALVDRHAALDAEVSRAERERDELRAWIDQEKAKRRLPVLDNIKVASPCKESWEGMTGDERTRLCLRCNQNVYNLSNMTREEAEALLVAKEGKLCVRYYRRKDGTILTQNCKVGAKRKARWIFGVGAVATLAATVFGFRGRSHEELEAEMGDVGYDRYDMVQGGVGGSMDDDLDPVQAREDAITDARRTAEEPMAPAPAPHVGMRLGE